MKSTKRIVGAILCAALLITGMSACTTAASQSITFNVETGDKIKVELQTTDSTYKLAESDGQFAVTKDEENILQGVFLTKEMYDQYMTVIQSPDVTKLEENEKDGNSYLFYEVNGNGGVEDDYIVWIGDSSTGVIIGSLAGQDAAKEAFSMLTFSAA